MNDLLNSIKTTILGTKTSNIDSDIDRSLQSIEKYSISSNKNKYVETIKSLISQTGIDPDKDVLNNIATGHNQIEQYDTSGRLHRYNEYDSIVKKISYCQRALEALTDNILSPDDITKRSLQYVLLSQQEESDNIKTAIARCKTIEKKIKLDSKIKKIIKSTLKKGDWFTEIILLSPTKTNNLTLIQENQKYQINNDIHQLATISENIKIKDEDKKINIVLEYTPLSGVFAGLPIETLGPNARKGKYKTHYSYNSDKVIQSKDKNPVKKVNPDKFKSKFDEEESTSKTTSTNEHLLKNVFISDHDPRYVIRLETERFKSCLGYLVFPKIDVSTYNTSSFMSNSNTVDGLCKEIIGNIQKKLKSTNDTIKLSDDLKKTILKYIELIDKDKDLKIRYVPPELMVHWRINVDSFDPYGESIFECVNFDCRLLMALKTATTIKNLTHATDKRVIAVETGLPRDAKNIVETLKEGINKKKISIDNMGSIDSIPSQIATFETIYIPMRDGKRFVEIDNTQWGSNPQDDVENQKFIRDNIVANLGVPAPYLGLEENMSNRSLLTVENINFCRTIISYQKELSILAKELFEKIIYLVYPDTYQHLDLIDITFPEPKVKTYEHQMEYVEQMQRLIEALKPLGIPVSWAKKKYLPNIDWDEISRYNANEKINQETNEESSDDGQMGMGMY